jgi:transposase
MRKRRHQYPVKLSHKDQHTLETLTSKGQVNARVLKRAQILLGAHQGISDAEIQQAIRVSDPTIKRIRKAYCEHGLETALHDAPRSGRPSVFNGAERAKITALACSTPPEGSSQWSLRLLADKAVELALVEQISHTQVGEILKKTRLNRIRNANGASRK